MRRNMTLYRMLIAAMLIALGSVLARMTGGIPVVGKSLCPMHIPALIGGLTLGWLWGGAVGLLAPLLGHLLGTPPFTHIAYPMALECMAYGVLTGILYPVLCKALGNRRIPALFAAQISAMLLGRIFGGISKALLLAGGAIQDVPLTFEAFIASYFVDTAVGAVIHLIVVPTVVIALEKAKLSPMVLPSSRRSSAA